jgi:hypothetical protein
MSDATTNAQREFEMFDQRRDEEEVRWLESYLQECGGWRTAMELLILVGREKTSDGARWVRALAEASDRVISGQKGYKHLDHCTADEVSHFVNWMESQGKKMIGRAERVRRNAHAVFG